MTAEAVRTDNKTILDNRSKILLCHCSSGHKQALTEILEDATFQNRLQDSRYAKETQLLQTFFKTLQTDPDRAYYGYEHVHRACDLGAIQSLLISDALFRSTDIATRRQYVMLVEAVKRAGRDVHIFSSLHPTGQRNSALSFSSFNTALTLSRTGHDDGRGSHSSIPIARGRG